MIMKKGKSVLGELDNFEPIKIEVPPEPKGCKKYFVSEIAFTMGWVNPLDLEDYESIFNQLNLPYIKILEVYVHRGGVSVYKLENEPCGLIITSSSGLLSIDNYIMFCGVSQTTQTHIIVNILKYSLKKYLPEVKNILSYKKMLDKSKIAVINPVIMNASEKVTLEKIDYTVNLINKILNNQVQVTGIQQVKTILNQINKILGLK